MYKIIDPITNLFKVAKRADFETSLFTNIITIEVKFIKV